MSDGCEMYGQLMLESLLARRATTVGQGFHQGSRRVGILLMGGAIAPLGLAAIVVTGYRERVVVARTSHAVIEPVTGVTAAKAPAGLVGSDAPMAAGAKQIFSTRRSRGKVGPTLEKSAMKS